MQHEYLKQEFQERYKKELKQQLRQHRKKGNLTQLNVADAVGVSLDTYHRWESTGQHLTDIFTLLNVFQVLDFSTTEIIDVLGLPPLTLNEVKSIYQDEDTLKHIKEKGICSAMRENCPDMDDFTLEKLLSILLNEHSKRLESRQANL